MALKRVALEIGMGTDIRGGDYTKAAVRALRDALWHNSLTVATAVGKSTHYHASYVYPYWVRSMRKLTRIGLHTFYRPRAWGDGSDEITWGSAVAAAETARVM